MEKIPECMLNGYRLVTEEIEICGIIKTINLNLRRKIRWQKTRDLKMYIHREQ